MYHFSFFENREAQAVRKAKLRKGIAAPVGVKSSRRMLLEAGYRPDLIRYKGYVLWDGFSVKDPEGKCVILAGGSLAREMRRMVTHGHFGDLPNLLIDSGLWQPCCDELRHSDSRSHEIIERFQISEFKPERTT